VIKQNRLIIGAAIGLWLIGLLITDETPGWVAAVFSVFAFFGIVGLVAYLMTRGTGWQALARRFPQGGAYTGELRRCRTFQMVAIHPDQGLGTRFSGGIVSVGSTDEALYIVMPSVVRFLFPSIRLPWSAIASAKPFEAPGWVKPMAEPGAVFQAEYDPGYRGEFVELETTEPKTRIRIPLYAIGDARKHLALSASTAR
jgi:hypothetical protein